MSSRSFPLPFWRPEKLTLLFAILAAGLFALIFGYWMLVLEPDLVADAETNARVLAQSQARALVTAIETPSQITPARRLASTMDELLLLTDQNTGQPFVLGVSTEFDYSTIEAPVGSLDLAAGHIDCQRCFVSEIPLYSTATGELIGLATFYSNIAFSTRMREDVRSKLLLIAALMLLLVALVGGAVFDLVRRLRLNEESVRGIFEATPFPLIISTEEGKVVRTNRAALELFKVGEEELPGVSTVPFYSDETDRHQLLATLQETGRAQRIEIPLRLRDGTTCWGLVSAIRHRGEDGSWQILAGVADITELKTTQAALHTAKEAAEAATRAKSEFLAMMSHEIRTPMNSILGMLRMLERTPLTPVQKRYVATLAHSGEALLVLLNDLLDISRIEAGHLDLQYRDFNLPALLGHLLPLLAPRADLKGVALGLSVASDVPDWIHGDEMRLRQILLNLIGNAIKFTDHGSVTISVMTQSDGTQARLEFSVQDTGIGIPRDAQTNLFDMFTQADSGSARRYEGSGLGLAICKRLVEAMGGTIGVTSRIGEGSTFFFSVPLQSGEPVAPAREYAPPPRFRPLRILVVDDDPINRFAVTSLLNHDGHATDEAASGPAAIEAAAQAPYDVILMDLSMPGMDGITATQQIRALNDPERAATPVIALTAHAAPEEAARCRAAGMDGFVVKPFEPSKLLAAMERLVATAGNGDARHAS